MTQQTYDNKLKNVNTWVEITNYYWHLYKSDINNKSDFWDDTLHSMFEQDWWDIVDVYKVVKQTHSDEFYPFPKMHEDIKDIERKLLLGKSIIRQNQKSANRTGFRAWMVMKDVLNNINGTPTVNYKLKGSRPDDDEPESPFERFFDN
jgi:hypothetical protein